MRQSEYILAPMTSLPLAAGHRAQDSHIDWRIPPLSFSSPAIPNLFFDGASWFPLLERDGIATCANFGGASRHRHVGDSDRRLPCALAPLVKRIWELGWRKLANVRDWLANYGGAALVSASAMLGGFGFFVYCQFRWGHWTSIC